MTGVSLSGNEKGRLSQGDPLAVLPDDRKGNELDGSIPYGCDGVTWLRLDDGFAEHPKIDALSDAAFRLHVAGLCYAARHLTDGLVPASRVGRLVPNYDSKSVPELMKAGLWERCGGGWMLHDFLHYNPTAADAKAVKAKRAEAGKLGGQRSALSRNEANGQALAGANAQANGQQTGEPRPVPSRPKPKVKTIGDASAAASDFDVQFWPLWPDKRDKGAARKAWPKAVKAAGGVDAIIEGVTRFAADPNLPPRGSHFMPHASTWLNGERWNDPPLPSVTNLSPRMQKSNNTRERLARHLGNGATLKALEP